MASDRRPVSVCFVFFRSTDLANLDAAWYSLSRQRLDCVNEIYFLDNNTEFEVSAIEDVLRRYEFKRQEDGSAVPVRCDWRKHGNPSWTHSWSVNYMHGRSQGPLLFFTRADYILDFSCLSQMYRVLEVEGRPLLVSGWCYQMAYDRELLPYNPVADIKSVDWRRHGPRIFVDRLPGHCFHETDQDAGVWLCSHDSIRAVGGMNERLVSWGYQQSTFQRALKNAGTPSIAVPRYLFYHMPHGGFAPGARDFSQARLEYEKFGRGI